MKPSWENILMITIMARRPLTIKAFNFAVIRPMPFRHVKAKLAYPMRSQRATTWSLIIASLKLPGPTGKIMNPMPTTGCLYGFRRQ